MLDLSKFRDPAPYPNIVALRPSCDYAEILMDDYAWTISELTAITQYQYHNIKIKQRNKNLANLLMGISLVEMNHLDILGQTILVLCGNPKYRSSKYKNKQPWSGNNVYYGYNILDKLESDLEGERKAINTYSNHIRMIEDPCVQKILERIVLYERVHEKLLEEAIDSLKNIC